MDEIKIRIVGDQVVVETGKFTPEIHGEAEKIIEMLNSIFKKESSTKIRPHHHRIETHDKLEHKQ